MPRLVGEEILTVVAPPPDQELAYGPAPEQFGELRRPMGAVPAPLVMLIHGGFWRAKYDLRHLGHAAAALTQAGAVTWNIEYRRVGNPGGGWPGTAEDVRTAFHFARNHAGEWGVDASRMIVLGHSAGGHLALWLGSQETFAGVLALAPLSDLRLAWDLRLSDGAVQEFLRDQALIEIACSMRLPVKVPQWFVHGTDDIDVPVAMSRIYVNEKYHEQIVLTELIKVGHLELIDPKTKAWRVVREVFDSASS